MINLNIKEIPKAMTDLKQWIITELPQKAPYKGTSWSNPEIYTDFETCFNNIYRTGKENLLPAFVLNNSGFWVVDLDNHENSTETEEFNNKILSLAKNHNLYITKSVSNTGYHIFGKFTETSPINDFYTYKKEFEFYRTGHYMCEDPTGETIQYTEDFNDSMEFLRELNELFPNTFYKKNNNTKDTEDTSNTDLAEDFKNIHINKLLEIDKTLNDPNNPYYVVKSTDATPKQLVETIKNHTDSNQRKEANDIFNGIFTNASDSLQSLYNWCYWLIGDNDSTFINVVKEATALYNHYQDKCKKLHRSTDKEIIRKINKSDLTCNICFLKFNKLTDSFMGFYNPPTTTTTNNVVFPDPLEDATNEEDTTTNLKEFIDLLETVKDKTGQIKEIKKTINNISIILENDSNLKDFVYIDTFSHEIIKPHKLEWDQTNINNTLWTDTDDAGLRAYLEKHYKLIKCKDIIQDAFLLYLNRHQKHKVKDYLESLPQWDGVERIPLIFTKYFGAEDTPLNQEIAKIFFTGAVKRIYEPACKFDYMIVLVGKQGLGKSTFFRTLATDFYTDSIYDITNGKGIEAITGFWIIEFSELSALTKSDLENTKHFITSQTDTYRVPYSKRPEKRQRQCIFVGTTNNLNFLRDTTGNRRFLCIDINKQLNFNSLKSESKQIWAEAIHLYQSGQKTYLPPELEAEAIKTQEAHTFEHPYKSIIESYLYMYVPKNWYDLTIEEHIKYFNNYNIQSNRDYIFNLMNENEEEFNEQYDRITMICPRILYKEAIQGDESKLQQKDARLINEILNSLDNWKQSGKKYIPYYGQQRIHTRK